MQYSPIISTIIRFERNTETLAESKPNAQLPPTESKGQATE